MTDADNVILSNQDSSGTENNYQDPSSAATVRRIILWSALAAAIILAVAVVFLVVRHYSRSSEPSQPIYQEEPESDEDQSQSVLPDTDPWEQDGLDISLPFKPDVSVEYLSFSDFYQAPDYNFTTNFSEYELPLNVKIDVMNYYDLSRKLNLDPQLAALDERGFALIDNPWPSATNNFASIYAQLDSRQIPLLLTADFITYYYHNILKKVFKDIEENVFYNNLWDINRDLYQAARIRYESRLATVGAVNDPILEAQRLETAFFAVALELLKPTANQIASRSAQDNRNLFSATEAERLNFVLPTYLRDDVAAEVALIRTGRAVAMKSPVFLYNRDYSEFAVPNEYKAHAKLNNFYLTSRWLNSVFPLHYRDQDCPDCLLDRADWRINLTAAAFIAQDFSDLPDLKNKWARIYKIVSFFRGLREDLNYIHYRDALVELFGSDYDVVELFGADNPAAVANLEKFQDRLLEHDWPPISGALAKTGSDKIKIGFKMLAESYWPNDYIFSRLTGTGIGSYVGDNPGSTNISLCRTRQGNYRCSGSALDVVNLVYPISDHPYFTENTNFNFYRREAEALRRELNQANLWQVNNYWAGLNLVKSSLTAPDNQRSSWAQSAAWRSQSLDLAVGTWLNSQLPGQKFSLTAQTAPDQSLSFVRQPEHFYIWPDLRLIKEIISQAEMMLGMFTVLNLDTEVRLAVIELRNFLTRLKAIEGLVEKQARGEFFNEADNAVIASFIRDLQVEAPRLADQQLNLKMPGGDNLRLDLSQFKLLALIHRDGDNLVFAVGPVWSYKESR